MGADQNDRMRAASYTFTASFDFIPMMSVHRGDSQSEDEKRAQEEAAPPKNLLPRDTLVHRYPRHRCFRNNAQSLV
jgi:hypothetical protein